MAEQNNTENKCHGTYSNLINCFQKLPFLNFVCVQVTVTLLSKTAQKEKKIYTTSNLMHVFIVNRFTVLIKRLQRTFPPIRGGGAQLFTGEVYRLPMSAVVTGLIPWSRERGHSRPHNIIINIILG